MSKQLVDAEIRVMEGFAYACRGVGAALKLGVMVVLVAAIIFGTLGSLFVREFNRRAERINWQPTPEYIETLR